MVCCTRLLHIVDPLWPLTFPGEVKPDTENNAKSFYLSPVLFKAHSGARITFLESLKCVVYIYTTPTVYLLLTELHLVVIHNISPQ